MKTFLIPFVVLACISLLTACSTGQRRTTTTIHESVETVPADTVTIERTSTETETEAVLE